MPHVITQSCCSDGSCVYACPVNCIHPSPDEPGFATAEMLYIDPVACVDCGACVSACPVGRDRARLAGWTARSCRSSSSMRPSTPTPGRAETATDVEAGLGVPAPVVRQGQRTVDRGDRRVRARQRCTRPTNCSPSQVCGSTCSRSCRRPTGWCGPAWRLTTRAPNGSRGCSTGSPSSAGLRFYLNVEIGTHLSHADLLAHHHAVLYAVGAPNDRRLDIDGHGPAGYRDRHRGGRLVSTVTPTSPGCRST